MSVGCFRGYSGCNGLEEGPPLQSPHHHMVEGLRGVEAGMARHRNSGLAQGDQGWNVPYYRRSSSESG